MILFNEGESISRIEVQLLQAHTTSSNRPLEAFEDILPTRFFLPTLTTPKTIQIVIKIPTTKTVKPAPKNPAPTGLTFPPHLSPFIFTFRFPPCRNWQPRE